MSKMLKYFKGDLVEYEIYKLVDFYDPILRQPTVPVKFDTYEDLKNARYIAFSMAETLDSLEGLGLSANQVGLKERVCAINMGSETWIMFNPEITYKSSIPTEFLEGCLSYPGLYLKLNRPNKIVVKFQALNGDFVEREIDGMTAVCIQHEIDHLDGIMFTDLVSPIKLDHAKRKVKINLKKMKRFQQQASIQKRQEEKLKEQATSHSQVKLQKQEQPMIQILGETMKQPTENKPEIFVYNRGSRKLLILLEFFLLLF